ncbi:MAG: T9SS type A sorting domain-containing protein [Chitinophagaceae bacterium]
MKIISTLALLFFYSTLFSQWTQIQQLPSSDIISLCHNGDTLYAGGKNRIYFSSDKGESWDSTTIIPRFKSVNNIIVYKHELYASSFAIGVLKSTDGGTTWQNISAGILPEVSDFTEWRGDLYASTLGGSVFKLEPINRHSWLNFSNGLSSISANTTSIAGNSKALIAGTLANGLYDYLPANSATWNERFLLGRISPNEGVYDISTGHDSLFIAGHTGRFYISTDNGLNWNRFGNIVPSLNTSLVNAKQAFLLSRLIFDGANFHTFWYYLKKDSLQHPFVNFSFVLNHFTYKTEIFGNRLWDASSKGLFYMSLSDLPGISSADDEINPISLPLRFISFNTKCEGNKVLMTWQTAQEENSSRFDIEKSNDETHWTVIGNRLPTGSTGRAEGTYLFTDDSTGQNSYYRIAGYEVDGKVQYSNILRSSCAAADVINLWPNPVRDKVFINIVTGIQSQVIIKVFDNKGALVKIQRATILPGSNQLNVDVQSLANGVYQVSIVYNNGQTHKTERVLKQ